MSKPTIECSNCNQCFEAHYPFCPYCGQQAEDKLTIGVLFSNTISNYFSVDARFFSSFIPLMTKPGFLAKKFVEGKRILYIHPAQMYLFVSVVFFFIFSFISREQAAEIDSGMKNAFQKEVVVKDSVHERKKDSLQERKRDSIAAEQILNSLRKNQKQLGINEDEINKVDSLIERNGSANGSVFGRNFKFHDIDSMMDIGASDQKIYKHLGLKDDDNMLTKRFYRQGLKFYKSKSGGSILQAFYDSIPLSMFILLPIFALILKFFYYNKGQFAHHLVFTFYFFSFLFTVFSILTLTTLLWKDYPGWLVTIIMFSTFFYLFFGVKRFYGQGYFLSFIKSNVITFLFLSMVIPFAALIMGLAAFLFY